MKLLYVLLFLVSTVTVFTQKQTTSIGFIENKGQIIDQKGKENSKVKYLLNTNGLNVQLRENGFSYDVYETKKIPLTKKDKELYTSDPNFDNGVKSPDYSLKYNFHRIDIDFLNSNKSSKLISEEKSSDYDNYYNVAHAPNGITNVHKYQKVTYQNIYNNIDVVFFKPKDSTKVVEYNFVIKPGGKVSDIQLKFNGGKTELVDNKIKMNLRFGAMEETLPLSWIENGSSKKEISVNYKKIKKNVYGFEGEVNHSNKIIVIDPVPVRLWGTYYGGEGGEIIYETEVDSNGFLLAAGESSSFNNIATAGTHQSNLWPWSSPSFVNSDCFITKFSTNGSRVWGTYLGGNVQDNIGGLVIDKQNNIIITGTTNSNLNSFTTPNAYQTSLNYYYAGNPNNFDAFLVKFNTDGLILWGTLFGGNLNDTSNCVAVDDLNNIIIGGITYSEANIATSGGHKTIFNNQGNTLYDGYFAKFNENGQRIWSTYFGGDIQDQIDDIKIDNNNNIYIIGFSGSTNGISTSNAFQPSKSSYTDGFITKFSSIGNQIWGTYFGGESYDYLSKLKITNNSIYITGKTTSNSGISTSNSFVEIRPQISNSGYDGLILKFDLNGNRIWSTYFYEEPFDIEIGINENIYIVGYTQLDNFIATPNSFLTSRRIGDGYIQKFDNLGNRIWGSYYGGDSFDSAQSISFDTNSNIFFIGGHTLSTIDIATTNAHQSNYNGSFRDGFLAKFQDCLSSPQISAINPCVGSNLELTASGGTNYLWTGPNGFTSTEQNPVIPNATTSHNGQYSCTITGTGGCDDTLNIDVIVGDSTVPIANIQNLPTITGYCNTIITDIPTGTDNCSGSIIATTTSPLTYSISGNYTIVWIYEDATGNAYYQNQNVVITAVPIPVVTSLQQFCIQDNATLNNIQITGQNITWYDAQTAGTVLLTSTLLQNGVIYYASQTINGCESDRVPVSVTLQNTPAPTGNVNQSFCSTANAILNDIVITGTSITWYENLNGNSVLPNTTTLIDGTTYYATQTISGCESINRLAITISFINTLNATDYSESLCDDLNNGFEILNLTSYNSNLITSTGNTFSYYNSLNGAENQVASDRITNPTSYNLSVGNRIIYVRIDSPNTCHQVVELNLTLFSKPFLNINDIMPICEGASITISAGNGFDDYLWSTGETTATVIINQPGTYSITVAENHGSLVCSSTKNFSVVNSNIGTITQIISSDWTANENTISVLLSSNSDGNYEYSLDGITYQNSPIFNGLESGEYTVYVNDKNGCGEVKEDVYLLMYPKFFTPNGDGYNDFWKIKFSENEPHLMVTIFDRYGKFIKQFDSSSQGWDGNYLGEQLPSTDYWFVVTRENGKEFKGHFTLKR
jgi:gliding motility-associated-like protein